MNNADKCDNLTPTWANQLKAARKLFKDRGYDALNNPHAMIGESCTCGTCFTCAANFVIKEYDETPEGRARKVLKRYLSKGSTVYIVMRKISRTSYSRTVTLHVISRTEQRTIAVGDSTFDLAGNETIEDITRQVTRFLNLRHNDNGILTKEHSELISYLAIHLFNDPHALESKII